MSTSFVNRSTSSRGGVSGPEFVRLLSGFVKTNEAELLKGTMKFTVNASSLYYLNERWKSLNVPSASRQEKNEVYDMFVVIQQIPHLKLEASPIPIEDAWGFNISIFHSVRSLEIEGCNVLMIQGLSKIYPQLRRLVCHKCLQKISDILVGSLHETALDAIAASKKDWKKLRHFDCSYNSLSQMDDSLSVLPGVRFINLSHNRIAVVSNLEYCYSLERLDLSHNLISSLEDVFVVLGNVHHLNLSANYITSISGLERLYGLEVLDISRNRIEEIQEIEKLVQLPLLSSLWTEGNPVCLIRNYRKTVFSLFSDRDDFLLDGKQPNTDEKLIIEEIKKNASFSDLNTLVDTEYYPPSASECLDISPYLHIPDGLSLSDHIQRIREENSENWLLILNKIQKEADSNGKTMAEFLCAPQIQAPPRNNTLTVRSPDMGRAKPMDSATIPNKPTRILKSAKKTPSQKKRNTVKFAMEGSNTTTDDSFLSPGQSELNSGVTSFTTLASLDRKKAMWSPSDDSGLAPDMYPILDIKALASTPVVSPDIEDPTLSFDLDIFQRKYVVDVDEQCTRFVGIVGSSLIETDIDTGRIINRRELKRIVDIYPDILNKTWLKIEFDTSEPKVIGRPKKTEVVCYRLESEVHLKNLFDAVHSITSSPDEKQISERDLSSSEGFSAASSPDFKIGAELLEKMEPQIQRLVSHEPEPLLGEHTQSSASSLHTEGSRSRGESLTLQDGHTHSSPVSKTNEGDTMEHHIDVYFRTHFLRSKVEKYKFYMKCGYIKYGMKFADERIAHVCITDSAIYLIREKKTDSKLENVISLGPQQIRRISIGMSGQLLRFEPTANTTHVLLVRDKEKTEKFIDILNLTWVAGKKIPPHLDLYFFDAETQTMLSELIEDVEGEDAMIDLYLFIQMIHFGDDSCRTPHDVRLVVGRTIVVTRERLYLLHDDYTLWPPLLGFPWPSSAQFILEFSVAISDVVSLSLSKSTGCTVHLESQEGLRSSWELVCGSESARKLLVDIISARWYNLFRVSLDIAQQPQ